MPKFYQHYVQIYLEQTKHVLPELEKQTYRINKDLYNYEWYYYRDHFHAVANNMSETPSKLQYTVCYDCEHTCCEVCSRFSVGIGHRIIRRRPVPSEQSFWTISRACRWCRPQLYV
jgi:hypothetical protein